MNDTVSPVTSADLARDLRAVVNDAEALLKQAADGASGQYDAARASLESSLRAARLRLDDAQDAMLDRARNAGRAADHYVHDHPWQAAGFGAAVGLAVGLLIGRR
jgi:ElaB/YqjD/DUF883 family membrane-anchored ribosome-binding protein